MRVPALLRPLLGVLLLGGLALVAAQCFNPTLPDCSYRCGSEEPRCPPEYECREDRYCHLKGSGAGCPYSMDLMPALDLRPAADLAGPGDGGGGDLQQGD